MNIGDVSFFEHGTGNGERARHWVVIARHPRWSLTWTFALWWWPPTSWRRPFGSFWFQRQATMRWPGWRGERLPARMRWLRVALVPIILLGAVINLGQGEYVFATWQFVAVAWAEMYFRAFARELQQRARAEAMLKRLRSYAGAEAEIEYG